MEIRTIVLSNVGWSTLWQNRNFLAQNWGRLAPRHSPNSIYSLVNLYLLNILNFILTAEEWKTSLIILQKRKSTQHWQLRTKKRIIEKVPITKMFSQLLSRRTPFQEGKQDSLGELHQSLWLECKPIKQ